MDTKVQNAIQAALIAFNKVNHTPIEEFRSKIEHVFNEDLPFMDKVALMDKEFDDVPQLEALREVFFDLILINFFNEDIKKFEEDYLDSEEWLAIEDDTLDRGTELLNVLLYLRECEDEELEPELADYLKEFLLVDEDEFQDEYRIYEDIIANQAVVESSYEEIAAVAKGLDESSEIKDLFYPIMSFFSELDPSPQLMEKFIQHAKEPEFEAPVYSILINFNKPY
jgi:hypothetical protein